jgi:hypothetical protein
MKTQADLNKDAQPMPSTKVDVFFEQFPWAKKYAYRDPVCHVYTSRIEPALLSYEPSVVSQKERLEDDFGFTETYTSYTREDLYLLDASGKIISRAQKSSSKHRKWIFFGPEIVEEHSHVKEIGHVGGTIANTLRSFTKSEKESIRFILSYWTITRAMIVYKVPKDCSFPAWIEAEKERERILLEKECAMLDAEGASVKD